MTSRSLVLMLLLELVLVLSVVLSVAATVNQTCFELPVMILSPVSEPFPTKKCVTPAPPALDCMKRTIDVDIEVIDHNDAAQAHNFTWNCLDGARTGGTPLDSALPRTVESALQEEPAFGASQGARSAARGLSCGPRLRAPRPVD
ncbi:hypothetical protein PINS_up019377 [Pythium insidiosum]|nr:hypothetical protein PINS_up019377 [Pythium insidiosum]